MRNVKKWFVLAVLSSALLLIVVDVTVLYTALPTLTRELHATPSAKLWIVNIYPLVVAGLLPGLGTLGDRFGHRRFFLLGLYVFGTASLCAAFAPSPAVLIGARALLALGAAMMMPATLSIIRLTFSDARERSLAIGLWAAVASGGAALGPVVGGVLLDHFWWGSVFLINVPIVVAAVLLTHGLIAPSTPRNSKVWDAWGSAQIMVGLVGLTYAIKELGKRHTDYTVSLAAAVVGAAAIWLFIRRQRRVTAPLINLALFNDKGFSLAALTAAVLSATLCGMELAFVQRLQLVAGMSPLRAALFLLPISVASIAAAPIAGWALHRIGPNRTLWLSVLTAGVAMACYIFVFRAAVPLQIVCLLMMGLGMGAGIAASSSLIMHGAPAEQAGMAASVEEVSFELGGAFGVTLMGSLLSLVYTQSLTMSGGDAPEGAGRLAMAAGDLPARARDSLDDALQVARTISPGAAHDLIAAARAAYDHAFVAVLAACAVLLTATAMTIILCERTPRKPAARS